MSDRALPGAGCRTSRLVAGLVMTGSLVASAGCGNGTHPDSTASPIPRVLNPRNIDAIADRPCQLLSPQQAAVFGLDRPPRRIPGTVGSMDCEWRSSRLDVWVYIATFRNKLTLEEVYSRRATLPYFELTEIGGYPAIVSKTDARLPVCDVDVKPAEHQSVTVSYDSTHLNKQPEQGCVVGRQVAEAVLKNLPPPS